MLGGHIRFGGNLRLRIYGALTAWMKRQCAGAAPPASVLAASAFAMTMRAGKIRPPTGHLETGCKQGI